MNREVLFRGKPIVCEELMEPNETLREFFKRQHGWSDYSVNKAFTDDGFVIGQVVYSHKKAWIVGEVMEAEDDYIALEYWVPVKPETVGQYTGVNDCTSAKIFEGDIFSDGSICVMFKTRIVKVWASGDWEDLDLTETKDVIIGNIHDNPEYLEVLGE